MKRNLVLWVSVVFVSAMLVGCVSSGKYERLETDNSGLQTQFNNLQTQCSNLQTQFNSLQAGYSACREQFAQSEKEKADLLAREKQSQSTYEQLMSQLQKEVSAGQVTISQYQDKLTVNVAEKIFFDSGSAALKPSGKEVLKKLGTVIKGLSDKVVRVEGHTDNVPIAKSLRDTYPTNWELSAARAITVARFLQDSAGVPPEMLIASALGQYHPLVTNDTPANRQKNRRIEIALQNKDVLKRAEAPLTPVPEASPTKTETPTPPRAKRNVTENTSPCCSREHRNHSEVGRYPQRAAQTHVPLVIISDYEKKRGGQPMSPSPISDTLRLLKLSAIEPIALAISSYHKQYIILKGQ